MDRERESEPSAWPWPDSLDALSAAPDSHRLLLENVAQGRTRYFRPDGTVEREFDNIFVLHFDNTGRCARFTEWYMQPRKS